MNQTSVERDELQHLRSRVEALEELLDVHEETVRQQTARLEERVRGRTWELMLTNQRLEEEIAERDRAQKALQESQERFELAMRGANDGLWDWNVETDEVYYSRRWKAMLGYDLEELAGRIDEWFERLHPCDRPGVLAAIEAYQEGRSDRFEIEYRMRHKEGHYVSVLSRGFGLRDEAGKVVRFVGTHVDLTQRKKAEEALRASEKSYREIFDASTDAVLVYDPLARAIQDVNQTACDLLGYSHDEFVKLSMGDVSLGEPPYTEEDAAGHFQRALREGPQKLEWVCKTRKRELVWVEVILKRATIGGEDRVLAVARDITERKQTELELARHREHLEEMVHERTAELAQANQNLVRFKKAIEQSHDGIAVLGLDERVEFVNPAWAAMHGHEPEGLVGQYARLFYTPEQLEGDFRRFMDAVRQEGAFQGEVGHVRKNGEEFPTWMSVALLRDEHGEPSGVIAVARDITEQRRVEEERALLNRQLLETSRRVGMADVATGVLHNVGNVLNSVNVSGTLVNDRLRNSKIPQLARAVERMTEHANDLGTFVTEHPQGKHVLRFLTELSAQLTRERDDVLTELRTLMHNIDHVKQVISMQQSYATSGGVRIAVQVDELIEDALRIQMASFNRHGVEVVRECQELPVVEIDKQKTLQILVNLLTNAKHALRDSPRKDRRLVVRAELVQGHRFRIEVADNGVGIPAENLKRIFSHGFTTKSDGHGYGLHNSALAAQEMGGTLTAHSDGPDRGATFALELPLHPSENGK